MIEEALQLLRELVKKDQLTETEFKMKEALATYVENHIRYASHCLEKQMREEGYGDSSEFAATEY